MTEYASSPDAVHAFRSSSERTCHWVSSHTPYHGQFRAPDSPPSVTEEFDGRDSDEDSSHSLPPKMVLRYTDGRADVPISHWHYEAARDPLHHGPHARPRPHTAYDRARLVAGRYHDHLAHHPRHGLPRAFEDDFSTPPEEIHILPSDPNVQPHRPTATYRPRRASEPPHRQPGSRPVPLDDDEPEEIRPLPPHAPPPHIDKVPQPVVYSHSQHIHDPFDHRHPGHSHSRGNRPPPSIVYAPAHRPHASDHYAPPTIVYNKAPGMTYTVSAPTGSGFPQYPRITATPYNPVRSNLSSVHEEPRLRPRGPMHREHSLPRAPSPISEAATGDSGSTYYIIPTPGQKVKVLVGPESLYTASSTTKSISSPHSHYSRASSGGFKKPLFSRLMSFASESFRPSRRFLQRRHSLDHAIRGRSRERC